MVPPRAVPVLVALLAGSFLCLCAMSTCEMTLRVRTPGIGEIVLHSAVEVAR
jgi:hypothetical protein